MAARRRPARDPRRLLGRPPEPPCGKVRYAGEGRALAALARIVAEREAEGRTRKVEQRVYGCSVCGWWHLTSRAARSGTPVPAPAREPDAPRASGGDPA